LTLDFEAGEYNFANSAQFIEPLRDSWIIEKHVGRRPIG
jgi:hypothetical protein